MLTPHETRLLASLRRAGGTLEEQRLCSASNLSATYVNRILADLEWRGLVVVLRATDGLVALLTPRGNALATAD
jgi:uncharacterized membrane protein